MGWWITLGILTLLAILPLGVRIRYNSDGLLVKIILGPVRLTVIPMKKKPKKEKKKDEPKVSEEPVPEPEPAPEPAPEAPVVRQVGKDAPDPVASPEGETREKGGSLLDFLPLVKTVFRFLGDFRRKLRINNLEVKLILGGGDPANLAINYGRAWAAVGNLMPRLEKWFVIKKRDIEVECDFTASQTLIIAGLDLTITLGRLLAAVICFAFRALVQFLKILKKRKGGAKQ